MPQQIAIVDNYPEAIQPIREYLEREGYKVNAATTFEQAKRLDSRPPDLWILDLRLHDDTDDKDFSGITLAQQLSSDVPKIVLTNFPSVQAVREALAPSINCLPPAVGFVCKKEPMDVLLRQVRLALTPRNSELLKTFDAQEMHLLPERLSALGAEQATHQLRQFIDSQRHALIRQQQLESRRASEYHRFSMLASIAGFAVIMIAIVFCLGGKIPTATVTMAGGLTVNLISALFCYNADKSHRRLKEFLPQIEQLLQLANLLELCNTFEEPAARDRSRQAVFDWFLDRLPVLGSTKRKRS